jgi:hypothetical protein
MKRHSPADLPVREQIVAILRDAKVPITSTAIGTGLACVDLQDFHRGIGCAANRENDRYHYVEHLAMGRT